jgi:(R,R)-butanediol dehydrogenase / meso-butanediol dehydrogenase / diacetyl reductase
MRALRYHSKKDIGPEDVPEPDTGPDDVNIKILDAGVCRSDVHQHPPGPAVSRPGEPHPRTGVSNPMIFGHELCGEVVELGDRVDGLSSGDLIGIEPLDQCGGCEGCRTGGVCETFAVHGYTRDGGASCDTTVQAMVAHKLPATLGPLQSTLGGPHRAGAEKGQAIAVHGACPIGLGLPMGARGMGIESIACKTSPRRREALAALFPLDGWIDRNSLDAVVEEAFVPLDRQEKIKVLVDIAPAC